MKFSKKLIFEFLFLIPFLKVHFYTLTEPEKFILNPTAVPCFTAWVCRRYYTHVL